MQVLCPSPAKQRRYEGKKPKDLAASSRVSAFSDLQEPAFSGFFLGPPLHQLRFALAGLVNLITSKGVGRVGGKPLNLRLSPDEHGGTARAPKGLARELWSS